MSATAEPPEAVSGEPRLAADPDVDRLARGALAALLSTLREQAGELWCGAALGGALAAGQGELSDGVLDRFELLAVLAAPLHDLGSHARRLRRAAETTARSRRVRVHVEAASRDALRFLPATLETLSCLSGRVVDGPPDLLETARPTASGVPPEEGLRLLARAGARLLSSGHDLDSTASLDSLRNGLRAAASADRACADAVLVSAGRYVPGAAARDAALRGLAADAGAASIHRRMTWTRFHDLVDAQRHARDDAPGASAAAGEVRKRLAHATDRWLEVLRLFEEARLGRELQSWSAYAGALAGLRSPKAAPLFDLLGGEPGLTRRDARRWPAAERLSAAVASLLDWDPGDLPLAPVLLDLPDGAPRGALVSRAAAWAGEV